MKVSLFKLTVVASVSWLVATMNVDLAFESISSQTTLYVGTNEFYQQAEPS